jgi:hypothetical protein
MRARFRQDEHVPDLADRETTGEMLAYKSLPDLDTILQ